MHIKYTNTQREKYTPRGRHPTHFAPRAVRCAGTRVYTTRMESARENRATYTLRTCEAAR